MEQPKTFLADGTAVVTCPGFLKGATDGLAVREDLLAARTARTHGRTLGVVPGTEDFYLVKHDVDGLTAAYCYTEFELVELNGAANRSQPPQE